MNENEKHKYENIWWKYKDEGHFLVDPILDSLQKIAEQHSKNTFVYYEYTQTIDPKKYNKVSNGTYKNGKTKYEKVFYGELSPENQYKLIDKIINNYITKWGSPSGDIVIIQTFEFNKNGNIHTHGIIRHQSNYEVHLRKFQQYMKKEIGRNSISEIRKIDSWIGYMLKDIEKVKIQPKIYNKELIDNKYAKHDIRHFM